MIYRVYTNCIHISKIWRFSSALVVLGEQKHVWGQKWPPAEMLLNEVLRTSTRFIWASFRHKSNVSKHYHPKRHENIWFRMLSEIFIFDQNFTLLTRLLFKAHKNDDVTEFFCNWLFSMTYNIVYFVLRPN